MWPLLLALVAVVAIMGMNGKKKPDPAPGKNDTPGTESREANTNKPASPFEEPSDLDVCRAFYEQSLELDGITGFRAAIHGNTFDQIYENYLVRFRSGGLISAPTSGPGFPGGCPDSFRKTPQSAPRLLPKQGTYSILYPY
jgi:hypothetical protein